METMESPTVIRQNRRIRQAIIGLYQKCQKGLEKSEILRTFVAYAFSLTILFLVWHFVSTYWFESILFPSPFQFLTRLVEMFATGVIFKHILISAQRILIGFVVGSAIGIILGLLMGNIAVARYMLESLVEFFRFIPSIAMLTVSVIWFGIGEMSKVFLILWVTTFIVTINTTVGVLSIPQNKLRAAACLGATRLQTFLYVSVPATVPHMLTGMRVGMQGAFTTIVAAEMLGAHAGIGTMLWRARLYMLIDKIFVALVTLSIMGLIADRIFRMLIYRFAGRYSPVA